MAGLYDRVHRSGLDGFGRDRINPGLMVANLYSYAGGAITRNQLVATHNEWLSVQQSIPLRTEDTNDIDSIIAQIDAKSTTTDLWNYALGRFRTAFTEPEIDAMNEQEWRSLLQI